MLHEPQNLKEVFDGGGPVMWPLLGASVVAFAVIVERMAQYSFGRIPFEPFASQLCEAVRAGDLTRARSLAGERRHPLARIACSFLDCVDKPREIRQELLQREGGLLLETVEKRLPILRLIVQIAPILGLLGTVHGLLLAFWDLEGITGPIRPSDIAGGIGSALTTTVFGLTIAIPASAFLLLFEEYVDRKARRMGFLVSQLEEALLESRESRQAGHPEVTEKRAG